jgi:hypothetical protein
MRDLVQTIDRWAPGKFWYEDRGHGVNSLVGGGEYIENLLNDGRVAGRSEFFLPVLNLLFRCLYTMD